MKKLLAIMTCAKNAAKAEAQRATWVTDIRSQRSADVLFFRGAPAGNLRLNSPGYWERNGDEITFFDVDDSYFGIPAKVRAILKWAYARGYDYVMKCDDDVYIVPSRFPSLLLCGHDYIGRFRGPHGNYPAHFASGFSYWLSERAMGILSQSENKDWMDERFVANRLAMEGIFGYNDSVSYKVCGPTVSAKEILKRKMLADGTVFCEYTAHQQAELHALLRHLPPVTGHPGLRQVPKVNITRAQFDAAPTDKPPVHKIEKYLRKI